METSLSTPPQLPNQMEEDASKYNEREGEGDGREEDEWAVLPDGKEKDEEMGMGNDADVSEGLNHAGDDDDDGGVSASGAANKVITVEECLRKGYPLHHACYGGATLDVIKYLVEEADGDKGKELLGIKETYGRYPLHCACQGGASLDVIKYLVEEADSDKGKEPLCKVVFGGMYPLHCACEGGASVDVIKYLVEEADGDKGKELLGIKDGMDRYPIHCACEGGASVDVIKYLVEEADGDKGKELLCKMDLTGIYPLHHACEGGASIDVIKYLVEEADGDKGKELLSKMNGMGRYPLHWACRGGASIDVIKYLVEEADSDKGKEPLCKVVFGGMYPLHCACEGGASVDVIKYLVEEADGDKGKELLGIKDMHGRYPLHLACKALLMNYNGASLEVIKYLFQNNPVPLLYKDMDGLNCLDYMNSDTLRAIWGKTHQIGSVADKPSDIDRLNYLIYARALVYAARQAEQPGTSLCIGLYGRWGGGKSTLLNQIRKCLEAEFLQEDALLLYNIYQLSGLYRKAADNAKEPFNKAVEKLALHPYVLNDAKKAWGEKSEGPPPTTSLTFLEHLAWLFLRIFCACQSCRKGYELENDPRNVNDVHAQRAQIKSQDARSRRMEMNAIFFLVFLVLLSPIWIAYWPIYLVSRKKIRTCRATAHRQTCFNDEKNGDNIEKEAEQIAGIIAGDVPLGNGDSAYSLGNGNSAFWDVAPCGAFVVIIFLQIVRAIASGISHACAALRHVVCFHWCRKTNHTPTGAKKYQIIEFNAWTYQGSELLWASLMEELWHAVEAKFGPKAVQYHRASIELADENVYGDSYRSLSPREKARNRKRALLMFFAQTYLSIFLFLIALTVLLTLPIINCKSINSTCLGKLVNITNNATDIIEAVESDSEEEANEGGVIVAVIATVAAFCPLIANVIKYWKKVRPFLRNRGDVILERASGITKRKDFKEELGFMGDVKKELGYLFDLLDTETYHDKEIGCYRSLRLCVFIDDLDRCPQKIVVSVLEAVILLLVDGPISVWMAIDSRIVVQCIEAEKAGIFDEANISGHEFLRKIVQLPFVVPELTNDTKKSYLDKIIDDKELDPARVLSRFKKEGLDRKLEMKLDGEREGEVIRKGAFSQLTRIATVLDEGGHIISRHDSKAIIGMTESELIKTVAKTPQNACPEYRENLCSIVSQATSQLILKETNRTTLPLAQSLYNQFEKSDSKGDSQTVPDPAASDDIVHIMGPPPSGLYIPMLNENDRRCLEDFMPFIDGNPRRMKRIINVFNLSQRIAELRCEVSPQLTAKILKMVILVEQWPHRMAWLLQLIEDVSQMSTHSLEDSRMNRFLGECFGPDEVLPSESCWGMICRVGILEVYRRIVYKLSMSNVKSLNNMARMDSDPQLFEGLLLCNGNDKNSSSEIPYAITVHDLRPLGGGDNETCLQSYIFNMPQGIRDKVSFVMSKTLHRLSVCGSSESLDDDEEEEDDDVVNGSDDSSEIRGSGGNSGGGSGDFSSGYENDDTDDGKEGGKSQNSSKTPVRGHTYETQKQVALKTASKICGKGNNKTMKTRAGENHALTGPTTDQRTEMEKEMEKKLYHAEAFKRMSDALGNRVQAALQCPELFKTFLTPEERIALEGEQLV